MAKKTPFSQIDAEVKKFLQKDLPRIVGKMAVDEFRENFRRQGFRNNGVTPWKEVKRRDPQSSWYGFQYKGERRTSVSLVKDRKTGKMVRAKKQRKLNFSRAATKRGILIGPGADLMNSIRVVESSPVRIAVGTDLPHAGVHNEGGTIRIFGKKKVKVARRQFIGESKELLKELEKTMLERIDRIVDSAISQQ